MDRVYRAKLSGSPPTPEATLPAQQAQPAVRATLEMTHPTPTPSHDPLPPSPSPARTAEISTTNIHQGKIKIGPWAIAKPHPLLWLSLLISIVALILEVPKGSLPTLTGRHKALRTQEKLVQERLELISRLATFLPPPLSTMVVPSPHPSSSTQKPSPIDLFAPGALRFWNANIHHQGLLSSFGGAGGGGGMDGQRWWSVEELGDGAQVVRSKDDGREREVWVIHVGAEDDKHKPLLTALTHSLLVQDKLMSDISTLKATTTEKNHSECKHSDHDEIGGQRAISGPSTGKATHMDEEVEGRVKEERKAEWEKMEERIKRDKIREKAVEEREREVSRREKWVVEEMRKLSDKVHSQAAELTMEDRITERLKAYHRQIAQLENQQAHRSDSSVTD